MAGIPKDFGQGGAGLTPGASGEPSLSTILHDIAVDIVALSGGVTIAPITSPALGAFSDPPTPVQMAALRTLVNELRTRLSGSGMPAAPGAMLTYPL
jgi:hypothetical protein